jgi:hypothetical protein
MKLTFTSSLQNKDTINFDIFATLLRDQWTQEKNFVNKQILKLWANSYLVTYMHHWQLVTHIHDGGASFKF